MITTSMFWLADIWTEASLAAEAARLIAIGAGLNPVFTPMTAAAVSSVEQRLTGMAAAAINAVR